MKSKDELTEQLLELMIRNNQLLESIDWKLWEIYNMMKDNLPENPDAPKK